MSDLKWCKFRKFDFPYKKLKHGSLVLLLHLVENMDFHHTYTSTYQNLAVELGVTKRWVQKCCLELERYKMLARQPKAGVGVTFWVQRAFTHGKVEEPNHVPPNWQYRLDD